MSSDGFSQERERSLFGVFRRRLPSLQMSERVGVVVTAVLVAIAFAFVLLYWFQQHGYAVAAYNGFLTGGALFDRFLGTNLFRHPTIWQAVSSAILAGLAVPLVGTFLVHREQALIGETLAHTAFAGVAAGIALSGLIGWWIPPEVSALVFSIVGAVGLKWMADRTDAYGDVPLAIVLTGSFAVGTLLLSYAEGRMAVPVDIELFLFGSAAVVTETGTRMMAGVTLVVLTTVAIFYKQLLYITFDSPAAAVAGINVDGFDTLLVVLAGTVVVGAMQVLGVILVAGLLVVPVAAASQLAYNFRELLILSVLFGEVAVTLGLFVALIAGLPSGGSIITVAIVIYFLAVAHPERRSQSIAVR